MSEAEASQGEGGVPLPALSAPQGSADPTPAAPSATEEFAAFYRGFMPRLVGFLMWMGASAGLAADLAQETMIKAYEAWAQIRTPESWTRKVASRELFRHLTRVHEEPVEQAPEGACPLVPRPDELAEWESRLDLEDILRTLPPRQRQVLAWSVAGYGPTEIARELGIETAAVRANLMKARRSVAARLAGREGDS